MKVVLGLGGTVDYEVTWDSAVFDDLVSAYGIRASELSTAGPIATERDLVRCVLAFLRDGGGGERFVASSELIEAFAARFAKQITLGGTPVRAAAAMRALGVTSMLHLVSIDDNVRRLLPPGTTYICSASEDSTDPHLIVQFVRGARVRSGDVDLQAPHPNRVILANDPPSRDLLLSGDLAAVLQDADIFLISSLNVMQSAELLDDRLATLVHHLRGLPVGAVVFYEDAGFHVPALSQRVRNALVGLVEIYSMNEDEMQAYLGRTLDLLDSDAMARALDELHTMIPARNLVVHTKYWSLARGERANAYEDGLRGGITMASTRYQHGDLYGDREYRAAAELPSHPEGTEFAKALEDRLGDLVCCVPAFVVDVENPTTIGLGDTFVGGFLAALARR